jgi:hypothetical protein
LLDEELRELERALIANPRDATLALRYLQALRRAGRVSPDALDVETPGNPGLAPGDLVLIARRSRPRPSFEWLPEMDALVGTTGVVLRLHRDGLGALLEGPSLREPRFPGDPGVGRSLGFASVLSIGGAAPRGGRRSP